MDNMDAIPYQDHSIYRSNEELAQEILNLVKRSESNVSADDQTESFGNEAARDFIRPLLKQWGDNKKYTQVVELGELVANSCPLSELLVLHNEFSSFQLSDETAERVFTNTITRSMLNRFDVDVLIVTRWIKTRYGKDESYENRCQAINQNLPNLIELEQYRPGAAAFFYDQFMYSDYTDNKTIHRYLIPGFDQLHARVDIDTDDAYERWGHIVDEELQKLGFMANDVPEIMNTLLSCSPKDKAYVYVSRNIEAMKALVMKSQEPSICKTMFDEFGICNFSRYLPSTLHEQYKQRDQQGEFGLVTLAKSDYNGAFSYLQMQLEDLRNQSKKIRLPMRIIEADSISELIVKTGKIVRKQKPGSHDESTFNKIAYWVVGAHGSVEDFELGRRKPVKLKPRNLRTSDFVSVWNGNEERPKNRFMQKRTHFYIHDDFNSRASLFRRWFTSEPSVVMISCSTGGRLGVAQVLSEKLQANVIAPLEPMSTQSVKFSMNGRRVVLTPEETPARLTINEFNSGKIVGSRRLMPGQRLI